jgi:hypothetical protein
MMPAGGAVSAIGADGGSALLFSARSTVAFTSPMLNGLLM